MNPRSAADRIDELTDRVRDLELALTTLQGEAKLIRFLGGAIIIAVIGLIVNAIGNALF